MRWQVRQWTAGCAAMASAVLFSAACQPDPSPSPPTQRPTTPAPQLMADDERQALLDAIEALYREQRYEEGLARLRVGLEQAADDAILHFHQGLFLQGTGDLEGAESALARALQLQPTHYPSYRALGDLARRRNAPLEAVAAFEQCLKGLPDHAGCSFGLALSHIDLGELDAAAPPLTAAAEQLDRADAWTELGKLERRRRRLDNAFDAFSRALGRDHAHLPALLGMGQLLMATDRQKEGQAMLERHRAEAALEDQINALRRAAAQPGAKPEIQLQLAQLYRRRDDREAEEKALREALRRSPGFPPAVLRMATYLLDQQQSDEAYGLVTSLQPETAGDPAILFLRGTIELARGDAPAAEAYFEASQKNGAWPPAVFIDAGRAWRQAGDPRRAASAFENAIAGLPGSVEAHLGLARSQRDLGAASEALATTRHALRLDPASAEAWQLLAVLSVEANDPQEARRAFSRGLEARRLDLLAAGGDLEIRNEVSALNPPREALELFDRVLAERGTTDSGRAVD